MIHLQESGLFYAYCAHCGVCGRLRASFGDVLKDNRAHADVCSASVAA